jgi:transketolase
VANFTSETAPFEIGKAQILVEGNDVSIIACGHLVWKSIEAARLLAEQGISAEVINLHTIKPFDEAAVIRSVRKTKCVVTAEEHQRAGGLGESVASAMAAHCPGPIEMVAVNDSFGESGKPEELLSKYGIDTPNVLEAAIRVIARKH